MKNTRELFDALPDGRAQVRTLMAARRRHQRDNGRNGYVFPGRVPKLRDGADSPPVARARHAWPASAVASTTAEYVELFCKFNNLTR